MKELSLDTWLMKETYIARWIERYKYRYEHIYIQNYYLYIKQKNVMDMRVKQSKKYCLL